MSNFILLIALAVIAVGLLIALIIVSVKLKRKSSYELNRMNELKLKDIHIDELNSRIKVKETTIKELEIDIQSLEKELSMTKNERDYVQNRLTEEIKLTKLISDSIPEKLNGSCDLTKRKDFVACWLRLQNEAFQSNVLKVVDDKILLKFK